MGFTESKMYEIFKHPAKKGRRQLVIHDKELREIFEFNVAAQSCALFVRNLSSGQVRPYSAREEFCNSEELSSIIDVYEEVARDPKRYWDILHAIVMGKYAIQQISDNANAINEESISKIIIGPKPNLFAHPYMQKAGEAADANENWVKDLAGKLPPAPKKKKTKKERVCWTTLEESKKIIGKQKLAEGQVSENLEERQIKAKAMGWHPGHGVMCGSPEESCSCDPQNDTCSKCGHFVERNGACSKCFNCGWSEGCS